MEFEIENNGHMTQEGPSEREANQISTTKLTRESEI
jgi:hypothetical protein